MGRSSISAEDSREEVRIVERLNYVSLEEAYLAGYDSTEWRRTVSRLATQLSSALQHAEERLLPTETVTGSDAGTAHESASIEVETDLAELGAQVEAVEVRLRAAIDAAESFAEAAGDAFTGDFDTLTAAQMRTVLLQMGERLREPSTQLELAARDAYTATSAIDAHIRSIVAQLGPGPLTDELRGTLATLGDPRDFDETLKAMREAAMLIRQFSVISVAVRKATRPAITGINDLIRTIETVQAWPTLGRSEDLVERTGAETRV